jgi:hypothetical protein
VAVDGRARAGAEEPGALGLGQEHSFLCGALRYMDNSQSIVPIDIRPQKKRQQ